MMRSVALLALAALAVDAETVFKPHSPATAKPLKARTVEDDLDNLEVDLINMERGYLTEMERDDMNLEKDDTTLWGKITGSCASVEKQELADYNCNAPGKKCRQWQPCAAEFRPMAKLLGKGSGKCLPWNCINEKSGKFFESCSKKYGASEKKYCDAIIANCMNIRSPDNKKNMDTSKTYFNYVDTCLDVSYACMINEFPDQLEIVGFAALSKVKCKSQSTAIDAAKKSADRLNTYKRIELGFTIAGTVIGIAGVIFSGGVVGAPVLASAAIASAAFVTATGSQIAAQYIKQSSEKAKMSKKDKAWAAFGVMLNGAFSFTGLGFGVSAGGDQAAIAMANAIDTAVGSTALADDLRGQNDLTCDRMFRWMKNKFGFCSDSPADTTLGDAIATRAAGVDGSDSAADADSDLQQTDPVTYWTKMSDKLALEAEAWHAANPGAADTPIDWNTSAKKEDKPVEK